MSQGELLALGAAALLIVFSAVLAVAETAFTHLGRARAEAIDGGNNGDDQPKRGGLADLVARRGQVLNPVLFLVLLCHLAAATIIAVVAYRQWGTGGVVAALAIELGVVFVVGEAAPKTFALDHTERAAKLVAPLVRGLAALAPLRWVLRLLMFLANALIPGRAQRDSPTVSEEELLALAGVAAEADVIEASEHALIESIIAFGDTIAREVMVPRTEMVTVGADFRVDAAIEIAIAHGFSRLPATGEGVDDIRGIVYAKDLMKAERDGHAERPVGEILRPARFVPETKKVAELLREMQSEQFHIAIVVDEYGGTAGLVTLEDVIEELVGEIQDEFDVEDPLVEPAPGGGVRVHARMPVDEINDLLDSQLPEGDWDSVGGLVYKLLGHVPGEGEAVEVDSLRLTAEKVQGRRIGRVRITPLTREEPVEDRS